MGIRWPGEGRARSAWRESPGEAGVGEGLGGAGTDVSWAPGQGGKTLGRGAAAGAGSRGVDAGWG
jgi:hypothetical protein